MIVEVNNAACGYNKKPVLTDINFTVETGETCCILGPNGCGKSTLFKSILGLIPLVDGSITVDGEDIKDWSASQMADTMAYVSQSHVPPFPYTVRDVVMLGRTNKIGYLGRPSTNDQRAVDAAISDMGISHLSDKVYSDISGGELQLCMIARAIAQEPKVLVLDEPTAALDYGNSVRVIDKVISLADRDYAIIMTTHSPDQAFMCKSNVVLLQRDAPMQFGKANDIITEKNLKDAYGVNVKIVEFINTKNEAMRLCSPVL